MGTRVVVQLNSVNMTFLAASTTSYQGFTEYMLTSLILKVHLYSTIY